MYLSSFCLDLLISIGDGGKSSNCGKYAIHIGKTTYYREKKYEKISLFN